jgi:NitT/TauT family transport system substrate-binding protein
MPALSPSSARAPRRPRRSALLALPSILVLLAACGGGEQAEGAAEQVRLGVFPNVTHAPALVGLQDGHLQGALGEQGSLAVSYFNAGGEAVEAIFSDAIDLTFIGPNPAINAWATSEGEAVRIIAGSTSGGAALVVNPAIETVEDLAGTVLASPALGNTQDVALRAWLTEQGYETDVAGGGEVSVRPLANPDILQAFQAGELDGAWVPEPWATRLVNEADGEVLLDEAELWPDGQFVTTHVLVRAEYLAEHPEVVRAVLAGHLDALAAIEEDPEAAQTAVLDAIEEISGTRLDEETIAGAWENLTFTHDPIASSLAESASDATEVGLLDPVELDGIYDLTLLNELLAERDLGEVDGL